MKQGKVFHILLLGFQSMDDREETGIYGGLADFDGYLLQEMIELWSSQTPKGQEEIRILKKRLPLSNLYSVEHLCLMDKNLLHDSLGHSDYFSRKEDLKFDYSQRIYES